MNRLDSKEFMKGPLVNWFMSICNFSGELLYEDLIDGYLMHSVFLKTNVHAEFTADVVPSDGDPMIRQRNLTKILVNLSHYYEVEKNQVIVKLPNVQQLAKEPRVQVTEAQLMLILLLGCAFTCRDNKFFVDKVELLDINNQEAIVKYIIMITEKPDIVLSLEMLKTSENAEQIFELLRRLNKERNLLKAELDNKLNNIATSGKETKFDTETENMKDEINEYRDELEKTRVSLQNSRKENNVLKSEMRSLKHFQDEADAAHENAIKVDRLELQMSRYEDKLEQFNLYKTQVEELQQTNIKLIESIKTATEKTNEYKSSLKMKSHEVRDLEKTVRQIEQDIDVAIAEKDEYCEKYHELSMENCKLIGQVKAYREKLTREDLESSDKFLSEELLMSSSQIRLERENRALLAEVEACREKLSHELKIHKQEFYKIALLNENLTQTCRKAMDGEKKLVKDKEELKKMLDSAKNDKQAERKFLQQKVNELNEKIIQLEDRYIFRSSAVFEPLGLNHESKPLGKFQQENARRTLINQNRQHDGKKVFQPINNVSMNLKKQENTNQFQSKHKVYLKPKNQLGSDEKKQKNQPPLKCSTNQKPNKKPHQKNKSSEALKKLNCNQKTQKAQSSPAVQQEVTNSRSQLMTENIVSQISQRKTETFVTSKTKPRRHIV